MNQLGLGVWPCAGFVIKAKPPARLSWKGTLRGSSVLGTVALLATLALPPLSGLRAKPADDGNATRADAAPKKPVGTLAKPDGRLDAAGLARFIDQAVQHQLDQESVPASPRADDAEFLRRVYLDITGVIPPADKVAAFLDSKEPDKRARVIDELLASPQYGRHLADIWQNMLLPRTSDNRRVQFEPMHRWLEEQFNRNKPWDQFAADLITASGPQNENGAVTFFIANPTPDKVNDTVTRLFLGVQLQCAQCHNHPFTSWKQDEYWGMAGFFSKVRMNGRPNQVARNGGVLSVSENSGGRPARRPATAKVVPPKFLQGEQPSLDKSAPYRPVLAKWLTSPKNPYFARAMVNRVWGHFFGRGLVNPVDDMHDKNPASHPLLLEVMAERFAAGGFDVKNLVRAVCNSETYQRTSKPSGGNEADEALFSHMAVKVMAPEVLYDSLEAVVGSPARAAAAARRNQPAQANRRGPAGPRAAFVAFFRVDDNPDPTEYQAGIPQALRLMNSPQLSNGAALLNKLLAGANRPPAQVVEQLYLATVSRRPTAAESQRLVAYVNQQGGPARKAYGDILWALLNSSEFTLNH